ncbi:DUF4307 domain-containing protein [Microlunatus elymi]|uniref:DUF4307 domain-containing protein n=1 Tax=Microlunatus elymi TaxID=2596828 RepID=UPI00143DEBFE|nr:DUF4307 domain-containing protein [Microlunatus elymi]
MPDPSRYPRRRTPKILIVVAVAVVAIGGIGWLVWAALAHAEPAVSGEVHVWKIESDQKVSYTLTVQRRDPSVPVACRVIAQAKNFETVGEKTVSLGASTAKLVDVQDTMRTLREATSVSSSRCWVQQ